MVTIYQTFDPKSARYYRHIDAILERIRSGKSERLVNIARDAYGNPELYGAAKKRLPAILFSGQFSYRNIRGLEKHSGFICLDFDKFPDESEFLTWRDTLDADEYTYSVFTSPSGWGLKVIVRIPELLGPDIYRLHKSYFRGLQEYYGCPYFDPAVFDVCRICFESYDPSLVINPRSTVWTGQVFDPPPVKVEYNKASLGEQETARRLLKWSDRRFPIVAGQRNQNLFRLCAALNDYGISREYALAIVSKFQSDDFKMTEIETTVKSAYRKVQSHGKLKF